eukprot:scaffold368993_cov34-Prasinocladus_malaysianus.AAC.1
MRAYPLHVAAAHVVADDGEAGLVGEEALVGAQRVERDAVGAGRDVHPCRQQEAHAGVHGEVGGFEVGHLR